VKPVAALLALLVCALAARAETVIVGSKTFTESVVLGEIATQLLRSADVPARHRRELGGSRVLFSGITRGDIDVYPEYTGTIRAELLAGRDIGSRDELGALLRDEFGLVMLGPLGFNNTYAIGVTRQTAERHDLETISDLRDHPELRFGFSNEFMERADGWPGLRAAYNLDNPAAGMQHDLAYRALESGNIQAMDLYATDAEIAYYDLVVLDDDLGYFPRYDAVLLVRADLQERRPEAVRALRQLRGAIDEERMASLNRLAKIGPGAGASRVPEAVIARDALAELFGIETEARVETRLAVLRRTTLEHLHLVSVSMALALVVGVGLGVVAARVPALAPPVLWLVGIMQTMPSLALLVLLIPLFGLAPATAIAALFLYSLLPIVRNTHAGLTGIPAGVRESARAIGLTSVQRFVDVELPMALPMILAGVKTAVVINVGTATLAALIGVGGYGQPILTGIRLDDFSLILMGAVPAAVMAIIAQLLFDGAERILVSRGLRL